MYTICLNSLINSFKVAFIYYLSYTVYIKEINGSKYNCGCQMHKLYIDCILKKHDIG